MIPFILISLLTANLFYLFAISVFPVLGLDFSLPTYILILFFCLFFLKKYTLKYFYTKYSFFSLFLFILLLLLIFIKFPLYYPSHDDLAHHLMAGEYTFNIWGNNNFMPMHLFTYSFPLVQMINSFLINIFGIRFSSFLIFILLSLWLVSLHARIKDLVRKQINKLILSAFFILIPFIPYIMATHGSFMTDYFSIILVLEAFYLFISKQKNKTFAAIVSLLAIFVKLSTSVFFLPIFIYFFIKNLKHIKKKIIVFFFIAFLIFSIRLYIETGNPFSGLFNSYFKSPLYALSNFKDMRWGPFGFFEVLIWPIYGQFTHRFGELKISKVPLIFFSILPIIGYLGSIIMFFLKRKIKYLIIIFCFLLWSLVSGYCRYFIPLNILAILFLIMDLKLTKTQLVKKYLSKYKYIFILLIVIFALTSLKTDFAWRSYPSLRTFENNKIYFDEYRKGLSYIYKDNPLNIAKSISYDFEGYDVIMPVYRGAVTFYSYLAQINGLSIIKGINKQEYYEIIKSSKVGSNIKENLSQAFKVPNILIVADKNQESEIDNLYITEFYYCFKINNASNPKYIQHIGFEDIVRYSCIRK